MAGDLLPFLEQRVPIVDEGGRPTPQFMRWFQDNIGSVILSLKKAQEAGDAAGELALRQIIAGAGLTGGGTLEDDVTLAVMNQAGVTGTYGAANKIPILTVNQRGIITAIEEIAAAGGGGGGGNTGPAHNPPLVADYTPIVLSTAVVTATDSSRGMKIRYVAVAGDRQFLMRRNVMPTPPFTFVVGAKGYRQTGTEGGFGVMLRNSANGRCLHVRSSQDGNGYTQTWSNLTTFAATLATTVGWAWGVNTGNDELYYAIHVAADGAIRGYASQDGVTWVAAGSTTIATYLGAVDQIGICGLLASGANSGGCLVHYTRLDAIDPPASIY
jgi:hypothetical protein